MVHKDMKVFFSRLLLLTGLIQALSLHQLSGQRVDMIRQIEWINLGSAKQEDPLVPQLAFKNAVYDPEHFLLPWYSEVLPLAYPAAKVDIDPLEWKKLSADLSAAIKEFIEKRSWSKIDVEMLTQRKKPFVSVRFLPLRINPATGELEGLSRFRMQISDSARKSLSVTRSTQDWTGQSLLRSGEWVRIRVDRDHIYKLTYEQLADLGISDPGNTRIFGYGTGELDRIPGPTKYDDLLENALMYVDGGDGTFDPGDYILFYGKGPHSWHYNPEEGFINRNLHPYSKGNYYFLTSSLGRGRTIPLQNEPAGPADFVIDQYVYPVHHEQELENFLRSGKEWYGERFDATLNLEFGPFVLSNLVPGSRATLKADLAARASGSTDFTVKVNGQTLGTVPLSGTNLSEYTATYAKLNTGFFSFVPSQNEISVSLSYQKNAASAKGWLNYITINALKELQLEGPVMAFRDTSGYGQNLVAEYRISGANANTRVWDVSVPDSVRRIDGSLDGPVYKFKAGTREMHEYVVFDTKGPFLTPVLKGEDLGRVGNQNLHGTGFPDMIIVAGPAFRSLASEIARVRFEEDGLDTLIVTPEQIYNEFSSGTPDVSAIRNFLKMFYDRASSEEQIPRYVLFFGDGSYDNRDLYFNDVNHIPTYQSENSTSPILSFATDDFFVILQDDAGITSGMLDLGIGRLPVNDYNEAEELVSKILSYQKNSNMGDWRNRLCFIGDDEDNNIHMIQANSLALYIEEYHPGFNNIKIFLDAYPQETTPSGQKYPEVNRAITERINQGILILNYTGHGGVNGLAHEGILGSKDIVKWENQDKLPLFMTATCEFSRYDDHNAQSAGELVLVNPRGGGIGLLTTTRLVYSAPNHVLNENFYKYVFERDMDGKPYRLGDIMAKTKNATGYGINKRNFTLLGDPSMELAYPKNNVLTTHINGSEIVPGADTVKALSKVTISGTVHDRAGNKMEDFNGSVYPAVYDKSSTITTLANDEYAPFTFNTRNRILYKGKATVSNGDFNFSFVVPKDITYNYGYGRLSFYAENNILDAAGAYEKFIIGGTADSIILDDTGPELDLYMNDSTFVFGGTTDENPVLLAYLVDSNGINTVGNGIGHDLVAILDEDDSNPIVLNEFYESDKDSYQSGKIRYPLNDLEKGPHKIKVKVWDVFNNSSESSLEFIVAESEVLAIKHVLNYPNPFTTRTAFYFEHNQPYAPLDVIIQIFTVSGKLVKTIEREIQSDGYRAGPIEWDGRDDYGDNIGRGVYIYRVKVRSSKGQIVEKYEKLVILN